MGEQCEQADWTGHGVSPITPFVPGISYHLGLDSSPAVAALNSFKGVLGAFTASLGLVGIGFGAFKGMEQFTDQLKAVFEKGKELSTLHAITGQSISDVVALRKAFSEEGLSMDAVSTNLRMLQKSLGGVNEEGQPTAGIFQQLGLSIEELKGEDSVEQLNKIGSAIRGLGDQASKTAAASAIFGRSGADMLAVFANPGAIDEAREATARYGQIMEHNATLFKRITNDLEALRGKINGFFVGFADTISPVLFPLLEKIKASINLVGFGQSAGREIAMAAQTLYGIFETGELGKAAGLALRVGFSEGTNWLSQKMGEIFDGFGANGPKLFEGLKQDFAAIKDMFIGLADVISGAITKGIAASLRDLKIGGIYVTDHGALNKMNMGGNQLEDAGLARINKALGTFGTGGIAGGFGDLAKGLMTPPADAMKELRRIMDDAKGRLNPAEFFGPTMEELQRGFGTKLQGITKEDRINPLSDRLAKIGGFIGGPGGVLGEQAQKDTAKNTGLMVTAFNKLNTQMDQLHDDLKPRPATF